ncbi:nucleotidyl transferase AbiEii/AbiGii toxin family protein [Mycoplasmopsis agalactiae]|uniref:nucleotidyl transferase AbiEii/AbiGii toxin family protein n=1 Tax=Mycoplasmopsis agalactiae TaxID=2110 RepID=UPI00211CD33E|nr:nucleotidyl transferase AbiEii/AbiGii toxin family protein [Mycoplasmopsis agalactiae]UUM25491.1 nucleotidyl transferase AbiEii/AbiGii toxin family protein [Mycoplasmopsis agalactiae]
MNKNKLISLCHKIADENSANFNVVLIQYFMEGVLRRISKSNERDNFVFKGGFLLSNIMGLDKRSTMDIDLEMIKVQKISTAKIIEKFDNILKVDEEDGIKYQILKYTDIRKEHKYSGISISLLCQIENIRQIISIDIASGDVITPKEIVYEYKSMFSNQNFSILAYNIETMLAEKLETIFSFGYFNTRFKDFYDVYVIYTFKSKNIDIDRLENACYNTFKNRNSEFNKQQLIELINKISLNTLMNERWNKYISQLNNQQEIDFKTVTDSIMKLLELIE